MTEKPTTNIFIPAEFSSLVSQLKLTANNAGRCPDQWVGDVEYWPNGFNYIGKEDNLFTRRTNLDELPQRLINEKSLIIILESPHTQEYARDINSGYTAIGPAAGATGMSIRNHLESATREIAQSISCDIKEKFHLFLINAIPYQCSLGYPMKTLGKTYRNIVFNACWDYAKFDFTHRLERYTSENTIVINSCTKGSNENQKKLFLRQLVDEVIIKKKPPITHYFKRCHPSSIINWKSGFSW